MPKDAFFLFLTVEDEEDIAKFKDYTPSASGSGGGEAKGPTESSPPPPPKKEAAEAPVSAPEPKTAKPSAAPPSGDRVFASPLARSLAEEHKVCHIQCHA